MSSIPQSSLHDVCVSIASSMLGLNVAKEILRQLAEKIRGPRLIGLVTESNIARYPACDLSIIIVATGGTEHILQGIANNSRSVALLYNNKYNSLPATIEFLAYYREQGREPLMVTGYRDIEHLVELVERLSRIYSAVCRLRKAKLGVIGGISDWLIYSRVGSEYLKPLMDLQLSYIDTEELIKAYNEAVVNASEINDILGRAHETLVTSEEVAKALRLYKALQALITRYNLDGFTIKCFDIIPRLKTTSCLALALFNTMLIPASCEGDIPLLISMALGEWITLKPVFMANIAEITSDSIVLAHCTSPIIGGYTLVTHFESGLGVSLRVDYRVGDKVTVYRLDNKVSTLRLGVGYIERHEWSENMCRSQVRVKLLGAEKILRESIGNHYALIIGDYMDDLVAAAKLLGASIDYFNVRA
ncbi:hypothetical protein [Desulfurococcus amylolyticus]|uniref:hypothetical protein n=1 Tax=Desulfurococcus amylolyticus TaxID=94694 RepID=UPI0023EF8F46|nr:hypothetical protein [Desulfurococcus amylolyticus]